MTDFNYFWIFKKENDKTFFPEDSGPAVPDKTRPNLEWNAISSVEQDTVKMNWKNEKKKKRVEERLNSGVDVVQLFFLLLRFHRVE
jgi:hypothetical protein